MESPQSRCEQIIHQHRVAAGTFVALLLTLSVSEAVAERARNVMEEPSAADFINQGLVDANPSLLAVSHYRDGGPCLVVQDPQGAIGDALLKCPNGDGPVFVDPEASGGMYYLIDEIRTGTQNQNAHRQLLDVRGGYWQQFQADGEAPIFLNDSTIHGFTEIRLVGESLIIGVLDISYPQVFFRGQHTTETGLYVQYDSRPTMSGSDITGSARPSYGQSALGNTIFVPFRDGDIKYYAVFDYNPTSDAIEYRYRLDVPVDQLDVAADEGLVIKWFAAPHLQDGDRFFAFAMFGPPSADPYYDYYGGVTKAVRISFSLPTPCDSVELGACDTDQTCESGDAVPGQIVCAVINNEARITCESHIEECPALIDTDGDGVSDTVDNCPAVSNANQADANNNGIGDACEQASDIDGDGVSDTVDNCPVVSNANQADADNNGIGDACDDPIATCEGVVLAPNCTTGNLCDNGDTMPGTEVCNIPNGVVEITCEDRPELCTDNCTDPTIVLNISRHTGDLCDTGEFCADGSERSGHWEVGDNCNYYPDECKVECDAFCVPNPNEECVPVTNNGEVTNNGGITNNGQIANNGDTHNNDTTNNGGDKIPAAPDTGCNVSTIDTPLQARDQIWALLMLAMAAGAMGYSKQRK